MTCGRCTGQMIVERCLDGFLAFAMWRCVNCGSCWDPVVAANRAASARVNGTGPAVEPTTDSLAEIQDVDLASFPA